MRNKLGYLALAGIFLITSCAPQNSSSDEITVSTAVARTLEAQNNPEDSTAELVDNNQDDCLPKHPGKQELSLPAGFIAGLDPSVLSFYDSSGAFLGVKNTPDLPSLYMNWIHPAGGITNGIDGVPLLFGTGSEPDLVKSNISSNIFQMDTAGNLIALTGAEGVFTLVVYSTAEFTEDGLISTLKIAEMGNLVTTAPQLTRVGNDQLVYYPLAVHVEDGNMQGIWFTYLKYQMSDFWFLPLFGLNYYDFIDNSVTIFFSTEVMIKGFSPDQTRVLFSPAPGFEAEENKKTLIVKDLENCQESIIHYHETTTIGGGDGVFSPDNKYLAWIEVSGFSLEESVRRLRVAVLEQDNKLLLDSSVEELSSLVGGEEVYYLIAAGWISEHVLLLETWVKGLENDLIIGLAPDPDHPSDPALGANQSVLLAEGKFIDFLYP